LEIIVNLIRENTLGVTRCSYMTMTPWNAFHLILADNISAMCLQ